MSLTNEDKEELATLISEAIVRHKCRFPLSDETIVKLSKVVDIFEELGNGDIIKGMRIVRENHSWTAERRLQCEPTYTENHEFVEEVRSGVRVARTASIKTLIGALITATLAGFVLLFKK